jgi:hypothetical protein
MVRRGNERRDRRSISCCGCGGHSGNSCSTRQAIGDD